eukprot:c47318_g1_i1.p1 GENE.c47318_g1_i1~~c47318_g1_i1.p1  ORF type:complete len:348 (-),score=114.97 c47318_g1_i1:836-1831(-)
MAGEFDTRIASNIEAMSTQLAEFESANAVKVDTICESLQRHTDAQMTSLEQIESQVSSLDAIRAKALKFMSEATNKVALDTKSSVNETDHATKTKAQDMTSRMQTLVDAIAEISAQFQASLDTSRAQHTKFVNEVSSELSALRVATTQHVESTVQTLTVIEQVADKCVATQREMQESLSSKLKQSMQQQQERHIANQQAILGAIQELMAKQAAVDMSAISAFQNDSDTTIAQATADITLHAAQLRSESQSHRSATENVAAMVEARTSRIEQVAAEHTTESQSHNALTSQLMTDVSQRVNADKETTVTILDETVSMIEQSHGQGVFCLIGSA